jgi:hypothetical protein
MTEGPQKKLGQDRFVDYRGKPTKEDSNDGGRTLILDMILGGLLGVLSAIAGLVLGGLVETHSKTPMSLHAPMLAMVMFFAPPALLVSCAVIVIVYKRRVGVLIGALIPIGIYALVMSICGA